MSYPLGVRDPSITTVKYLWDVFPVKDELSRISSIGIMEYDSPSLTSKEYRFHALLLMPKEKYINFEGKLVGVAGTFPRSLGYTGKGCIGFHEVHMHDRLCFALWGKFDKRFIDDVFTELRNQRIVVHEDCIKKLKYQIVHLLEYPQVSQIAQMRFEASEWLTQSQLNIDERVYLLVFKLTKLAIFDDFEPFTISELKGLAGQQNSFLSKYAEVFKLFARFKFYRGHSKDFVYVAEAQKLKNSCTSIMVNWVPLLKASLPRDLVHNIVRYLAVEDMPQKKGTKRSAS